MKTRKTFTALAAAGLLMAFGAAQAADTPITFSFNPNGTGAAGAIAGAGSLDEAPGNAIGIGGVNTASPGAPLAVGTTITDYYQANLAVVNDSGGNGLFLNGTASKYFTFVAVFQEVVTAATINGGSSNNSFSILSGTFKMCAQSALGNNLAGTGFACAGNGILSGTINGGNATQSGFVTTLGNLDNNANGNNYPGVQTITSSGAANLFATINTANALYFPDLPVGTSLVLSSTNSSLITPYNSADPSAKFSSDGIQNGNVNGVSSVGTTNGISGPNFMFQADANSSFLTSTVPEPGTLALAGLALAGLAMVRRRSAK